MSLALWSVILALFTLVVISVTAVAALIHMHHARQSNQIAALMQYRNLQEEPNVRAAFAFVYQHLSDQLHDPSFRAALEDGNFTTPALAQFVRIGLLFEDMGALVKYDILDATLVCDLWSKRIDRCWTIMRPAIEISRIKHGPALLENFEYLTVLARKWIANHPHGVFPKNVPRLHE